MGRKKNQPPPTRLIDRITAAGSTSLAFVGLSRQAGKTTALRHVIAGLTEKDAPFGVASAGRRDEDLEEAGGPASLTLQLGAGAVVATTAPAAERATARLDVLDEVPCSGLSGRIVIARVGETGEVELIGPGTGPDLQRTVTALRAATNGPILIEGSLTRRAFAAPGVAEYVVLAVGAGLSPSMDLAIPAVRYYVELFDLPLAPPEARHVWESAFARGRCVLVDGSWNEIDSFHWHQTENSPSLLARTDMGAAHLVIPRVITDEAVIPLLREEAKMRFIVRDPMCNTLSPVYNAAWEKRGGGVTVIHRPRLLAVTANPQNPTGPDYEAAKFLEALTAGLDGVPVHDVVKEALDAAPKKRWFGRKEDAD